MGLKKDIRALIAGFYENGRNGRKIATRLIEAGLEMMFDEGDLDGDSAIVLDLNGHDSYAGEFKVLAALPRTVASVTFSDESKDATLRWAGQQFDFYARNHYAKIPPQTEKAQANVEAAAKMFAAVGEDYAPPEAPSAVMQDWIVLRAADSSPVESDSGLLPADDPLTLLRWLHDASEAGEPIKGVRVHVEDIPAMNTFLALGLITRGDVDDNLGVTTKGRDALGIKPEGTMSLPVEVAEITGNIDEHELAARYIDDKIRGVDSYIAKHDRYGEAYKIVAQVLSELANEFRGKMHHPTFHIDGRIIPYNEDRTTGIVHADALRIFFEDVHARNVKAGWWSDIETGLPKKRNVGELLMLFVTEIWEAYDAYVLDAADDKLPNFQGFGVELADLGIRWADLCGALLAGRVVRWTDTANPGERLFRQVGDIATAYELIRKTPEAIGEEEKGDFLEADDVAVMADAKLAYNAKREDHKIENRLRDDGKKT